MKAITIKKQIQFVNMQMKVGELYIFNEAQLYHFVDALKKNRTPKKRRYKANQRRNTRIPL